jgi:hypothetical protein
MNGRKANHGSLAVLGAAALFAAALVGQSGAQGQTETVKSARGGVLAKTGRHQFEVFFYPTGVRVFVQGNTGTAIDASRLNGTATFYHPNSTTPWFSRQLRGQTASIDLPIGLSNAPQTGAKVTFEVAGLTDASESKATFTTPLEFVTAPTNQPTAPQGGVPTLPRYVYRPGPQGYGYYEHTSPGTYSTPSGSVSYMSSIPGMYGPGGMSVGPGHRDWTTGRSSPLAKPWLSPMD